MNRRGGKPERPRTTDFPSQISAFLAWIRTSLALLAGAVAIDQLAPNIAPQPVRIVLCVVLSIIGAGLATLAYRRWAQMEAAMRNDQALPFSRVMVLMTIVVAVAAFTFAVLILVAR